MTDEQFLQALAQFFLDEFAEDPEGVACWVEGGELDIEEFVAAAKASA